MSDEQMRKVGPLWMVLDMCAKSATEYVKSVNQPVKGNVPTDETQQYLYREEISDSQGTAVSAVSQVFHSSLLVNGAFFHAVGLSSQATTLLCAKQG